MLMDCKRIAPRRRVLKAGSIEVGGEAIACTVRNLSDTGAALEVVTPLFYPRPLHIICSKWATETALPIVWRKGTRIGVAFD
jgi:hypothetical protein